ncbi:MAG: hypothetical protein L3J53_06275 [Proteobacteria bacterium]|nr:hypothetical protein [Pseudomonadota bacterium]
MNELIIIGIVLVASIGLLLYFIGWINTIFMALGRKQFLLAITLLILSPLAIYYCSKNWQEAATQGKQMIAGLLIFCVIAIPAYLYVKSLTVY